MKNRLRAASWILCDSDATVKEQLEWLDNYEGDWWPDEHPVSIWERHEGLSPQELKEDIDNLEKEFDEVHSEAVKEKNISDIIGSEGVAVHALRKKYEDLEAQAAEAFNSFKAKDVVFLSDDELEIKRYDGTLEDYYEYRNEYTGEIQSAAVVSVKNGDITVVETEGYNVRAIAFSDLADIRDRLRLIEELERKTA